MPLNATGPYRLITLDLYLSRKTHSSGVKNIPAHLEAAQWLLLAGLISGPMTASRSWSEGHAAAGSRRLLASRDG